MLHGIAGQGLISNYAQRDSWTDHLSLQPYESFAIAYACEAGPGQSTVVQSTNMLRLPIGSGCAAVASLHA